MERRLRGGPTKRSTSGGAHEATGDASDAMLEGQRNDAGSTDMTPANAKQIVHTVHAATKHGGRLPFLASTQETPTAAATQQSCTKETPDTEGSTIVTTEEPGDSSAKGTKRTRRQRCWDLVKRHPYIVTLVLILMICVIAALLLMTFVWIIPFLIQSTLDATSIRFQRALLTHPQRRAFHLEAEALVERSRGQSVTLKSFPSKVFYVPSPELATQHPPPRRQLQISTGQQAPKSAAALLLRRLDPAAPEQRYALGSMTIPEAVMSGRSSILAYNSTFHVLSQGVFDAFTRELLTRGQAQWVLEGRPDVELFGITYRRLAFKKTVQIEGPRLVDDLDDTNHPTMMNGPSKEAETASAVAASPEQKNRRAFRITAFDMNRDGDDLSGLSAASPVGIPLSVVGEFESEEGQAAVDPLGVLRIGILFNKTPITQLQSTETVRLFPGTNHLAFSGVLPRLENCDIEVRGAITDLFRSVLRGEAPVLEARGLTTSIPLYAGAIQTIRLTVPLRLRDETAADEDPSTTAIVRRMDILETQLLPDPRDASRIEVKGRSRLTIANPFGPLDPLRIAEGSLRGALVLIDTSGATDDSLGPIRIATFTGRIYEDNEDTSAEENSAEENGNDVRIGVMGASTETLDLRFTAELTLTDNAKPFTVFARRFIEEPSIHLGFDAMKADVAAVTPIGTFDVDGVPFNQETLPMTSLGGLSGVRLAKFELGTLPFFSSFDDPSAGMKRGTISIAVSVVVPSQAATSLYIGTLSVDLRYRNTHLAYMSAPGCAIEPGDSLFNFTGAIRLVDVDLTKILPLVANYVAGRSSVVQAEFVRTEDVVKDATDIAPPWIEDALAGMQLSVPLPGLSHNDANSDSTTTLPATSTPFGRGGLLASLLSTFRGTAAVASSVARSTEPQQEETGDAHSE